MSKAMKWDRARSRGQTDAAYPTLSDAALLDVLTEPSKAELRAEAEALTAGVAVTRCQTVRRLHCRVCGHQGTVRHDPDRKPRFRCKRCGARA